MAKLATAAENASRSPASRVPRKNRVQVLARLATNARDALARVRQHRSPAEEAKVRAAVIANTQALERAKK